MMSQQVTEEANVKVPVLEAGTISFSHLDKATQDRFLRNETIVNAVLIIVALTLAAILLSVVAIVLDQLHFNNQVYRDGYSQPVQNKTITVPTNSPAPVFKKLP